MPTSIVRSVEEQRQLSTLVAEYEASLPSDLRHDYEPIVDAITNVGMLATLDGAPAGCVFVTRFNDESAIIQRLYVRPEARGHGLARALMQDAAHHARTRGYRRLILDTDKSRLQAAYQLYLSLGFTECDSFGPVSYEDPTYMEFAL